LTVEPLLRNRASQIALSDAVLDVLVISSRTYAADTDPDMKGFRAPKSRYNSDHYAALKYEGVSVAMLVGAIALAHVSGPLALAAMGAGLVVFIGGILRWRDGDQRE
jgi:hypothetical protein